MTQLWPAKMKPYDDELLSSWLVRLAMAHGLKLNTFSKLVWNKSTIWNRDLDKSASESIISVLHKNTGFSLETINQTLLSAFTGSLYEKHNPNGSSLWIMPIGVFHSMRTKHGLQMCPLCLKEDRQSYFRRYWRLSFVTVCLSHKLNLLDRCPNCQNPINFHRGELGNRNKIVSNGMTICSLCNCDWRSNYVIQNCTEASTDLVKFQEFLINTVTEKWAYLRGQGGVHSILFFKGLYQLLKILACSKTGIGFQQAVSKESQIPVFSSRTHSHQTFDNLNIQTRQAALRLANWLLSDWSGRFIDICLKYKIWSSVLFFGNTDIPFWYWNPVYQNLYRISYFPSNNEIKSVINYLKKKEEIITYKKISRTMGVYTILKNRSPSFVKLISDEIVDFVQTLSPNYSIDLRRQIIEIALNSTLTHKQIAAKFGIKYTLLTNLISKSSKTGHVLMPREIVQIIKKV